MYTLIQAMPFRRLLLEQAPTLARLLAGSFRRGPEVRACSWSRPSCWHGDGRERLAMIDTVSVHLNDSQRSVVVTHPGSGRGDGPVLVLGGLLHVTSHRARGDRPVVPGAIGTTVGGPRAAESDLDTVGAAISDDTFRAARVVSATRFGDLPFPPNGPAGQRIRLNGTNFAWPPVVSFEGATAELPPDGTPSDTHIDVTVPTNLTPALPPGQTRDVRITVTTAGGSVTSTQLFSDHRHLAAVARRAGTAKDSTGLFHPSSG